MWTKAYYPAALTGIAASGDIKHMAPGNRVTIELDGPTHAHLTLSLTEVRGTLTHRADRWVYGIDHLRRLRLVLLRPAPEGDGA